MYIYIYICIHIHINNNNNNNNDNNDNTLFAHSLPTHLKGWAAGPRRRTPTRSYTMIIIIVIIIIIISSSFITKYVHIIIAIVY